MNTQLVDAGAGVTAAAAVLASGDLVALPTETVYGLGASALDPEACAKIFEAKQRPLDDPLIIHLPNIAWLDNLAQDSVAARALAAAFWPGPLTMVLKKKDIVPAIATAGQDTVALRMSAHPVFQKVATVFGKPIAAPSANRFGRISPTTAEHVLAELNGRIPLIVDGGPCIHGIESTIVLVDGEELEILRHGPIDADQLSQFGKLRTAGGNVAAPGAMKSHYAPRTRLIILNAGGFEPPVPFSKERAGFLSWSTPGEGYAKVERLTKKQNLREAAANLYAAMRRLDESGAELIVAEPVPEEGLGIAIMDRLRKAAARE